MNREDCIQEIIEYSGRLKKLAMADRAMLENLQLSRAQLELVFVLFSHDSVNVKHAAEITGVSTSAISQVADSLLAEGYIARTDDPNDRRVTYLTLTAKGRSAIKSLRNHFSSGFRAALGSLSDDELLQFSKIYKKLVEAADINK
ncbi:MAG TPA: MarR family transcriptional regulator [Candidatus Saccharimonadales bacterium]|nr:MarR family transcriptional regulator [Candidatus Saccharimonadales bacterium]